MRAEVEGSSAAVSTSEQIEEPQEQAIACLTCGASDVVRSDDERAVQWPAWEPGPHFAFCPKCGGTAWATEPREAE
jgi:hypothetical protein